MRIFSDPIEAYYEIRRDLLEVGEWISGHSVQDKIVEGNPDFDFMELSPYVYALTPGFGLSKFIDRLGLSRNWLTAEFHERLQGNHNPGLAWKLRREIWEPFIERDGTFAYTYSERLHKHGELRIAREELTSHPSTRQAIVGIYDAFLDASNVGGKRRIPCSMFYQFMVRDSKLKLLYVMRSCDLFTHFPYDLALAIMLQKWMSHQLEREVGLFTHIITSLHGFRHDFTKEVF